VTAQKEDPSKPSVGGVYERVLALTFDLISRNSITPDDNGCQTLIAKRLAALGFSIETLNAGPVQNLWAVRQGQGAHLMFAGHTDVVPTGPIDLWQSDPFVPTIRNHKLYGRGAADMKSSLAAMVVSVEECVRKNPPRGTLSFLITSDEEGDAIQGTRHVVDTLAKRGIKPDYCIVGEPSSSILVGDVVRCGRRGSLNATLTVMGKQGHVAYPQDADNPIHRALAGLQELSNKQWDQGNEYYPPTSFQISNITSGTGATNVIPGELSVKFNFRFSSQLSAQDIQTTVAQILDEQKLTYQLEWQLSGNPFLTRKGKLTDVVCSAIEQVSGVTPELSTSGGTSDGRFICPWTQPGSGAVELVELGPTNATIHKIDECIGLDELEPLTAIYQHIIEDLL